MYCVLMEAAMESNVFAPGYGVVVRKENRPESSKVIHLLQTPEE